MDRKEHPSDCFVVVTSQSELPVTSWMTPTTPFVFEVRPWRLISFRQYSISQSIHLLFLKFGEITTIVTDVPYIISFRFFFMVSVALSVKSGESAVSP